MRNLKIEKSLKRKGYMVSFYDKREDAIDYLINNINNKTVGFGDSKTLESLSLNEQLSKNNTIIDPSKFRGEEFNAIAKSTLLSDVFISSVNAASETGELINIDSTGNRVAGALFGHEKVFFIFGTNKIEPTMDKAIWRARNIAAPINAKRFNFKTPCAINGDRCYDCNSPDRICNALTIHLNQMKGLDVEVIIIDEELGY